LARNSEAPSLIDAELAAAGFVTGFSCTDCPYITPICTGKYNAMSNVVRAIVRAGLFMRSFTSLLLVIAQF
jgi:hypothetical protein